MKIRNISGPRTVPRGTPLVTAAFSEDDLLCPVSQER